jgi:hypothetical protein
MVGRIEERRNGEQTAHRFDAPGVQPGTRRLWRAMKATADLKPQLGPSARTLGVRVPPNLAADILPDREGWVRPGTGGVSVSPDTPIHLHPTRRPVSLGGWGKDPLFSLRADYLGDGLQFRPDPRTPNRHGLIEPARPMKLEEFRALLNRTQTLWEIKP